MEIKKGDKVIWCYRHHLNSKSATSIVKHGIYIAKTRCTYRYNGPQLAAVEFDGNKRLSKIPLYELKTLTTIEGGKDGTSEHRSA